ncbi:MAG: iron-containing alcohol dehydrogenase [Candidatus Thermoplasmatota archaeon]|nr:iron-containing alcohol dehydrogenase [Candidatus Thermoplasmatota archaeon]MCL5437183.1 iron-containing alcohol dehydrogenase [Candidatus Thermoplasmatota archaeon]
MGIYIEPGKEFTGKCGQVHSIAVERVIVGKDAIHSLPDMCSEFGTGKRVLLVGDEMTGRLFLNRIKGLFSDSSPPSTYTIVTSTMEEVERLASEIDAKTLPVAVGGGAVIDTVKLAAHRRGVRFISVPTSPSHDGMVSPTASIIVGGKKTTQTAIPPVAALFDLAILGTAPQRMVSAGYGDVFAKFTSLKDWELAHVDRGELYCEDSVEASTNTLHDIVNSVLGTGIDLQELCYAVINSGLSMVLAGTSRPESGSEHMISHYIDQNSPNGGMHGEQVALSVQLLSYYHREKNELWWKEKNYQPEMIAQIMEKVKLPHGFSDIGVVKQTLSRALIDEPENRKDKYTILHKFPFSESGAAEFVELHYA